MKKKQNISPKNCIFVKGSPSTRDENSETLKMIARDVFPLSQTREKLSRHINVMIDSGHNDMGLLDTLKNLSDKNKGRRGLVLHLKAENGSIQRIRASKIGVSASKNFIQNLRDIFGGANVWIT